MDTSEQYIKMCDCPEIQGLRPVGDEWQEGDYYMSPVVETMSYQAFRIIEWRSYIAVESDAHGAMPERCEGDSWLPRQDQLQEISGLDWPDFDYRCKEYAIVADHTINKGHTIVSYCHAVTKEVAGLQVVMRHNHNKIWDGEAWQLIP